jgi:hypothetical protein
MTKDEIIASLLVRVQYLQSEVQRLEARLSGYSWQNNPDRSGGQYDYWEKNRRGDEFS